MEITRHAQGHGRIEMHADGIHVATQIKHSPNRYVVRFVNADDRHEFRRASEAVEFVAECVEAGTVSEYNRRREIQAESARWADVTTDQRSAP